MAFRPLADIEGNVFEGPEGFLLAGAENRKRRTERAAQMIAEERAYLNRPAPVTLRKAFAMNDRHRHGVERELDPVGNSGLHAIEEEDAAKKDERDC